MTRNRATNIKITVMKSPPHSICLFVAGDSFLVQFFPASQKRMPASGGDIASSVVRKIAEQTRRQAIADAITAIRGPSACECIIRSPSGTATLESLRTAALGTMCGATSVTTALATPLRGVASSLLTHIREADALTAFTNDPSRRFIQYQGPFIPTPCPPTPVVVLEELTPLERSLVMDAIREIAAVQRRVGHVAATVGLPGL